MMYICSNLAISLDGKIATASKVHFPLGTPEDRKQMIVIRKTVRSILMGASTLRAYKKPLIVGGATEQPLNLLLSSNLEGLDLSWAYFTDTRIKRVIYADAGADPKRVAEFKGVADVVMLPRGKPLALEIVRDLKSRGIDSLLVEGGGGVMWQFCEHNLIDEYYVTLTPRVLGGTESPTLVDGPGFSPEQVLNLKLAEVRQVGDELYLKYSKTEKRGQ